MDKIKEYTAKPVNFVIGTVYTDGIKKLVDSITDALGLDLTLPTISKIDVEGQAIMSFAVSAPDMTIEEAVLCKMV